MVERRCILSICWVERRVVGKIDTDPKRGTGIGELYYILE